MKKLLLILSVIGLVACSSDQTPTPQKLSQDVQSLPPETVISVSAENSFPTPKNAQVIQQLGSFRTIDNVYDKAGNRVLIPRNAIISGTYTNDGVSCQIAWKSVYANKEEYEEKRGSFVVGDTSVPSVCNPVRGIKAGDRLTISFTTGGIR
jgi:hypothetical protein